MMCFYDDFMSVRFYRMSVWLYKGMAATLYDIIPSPLLRYCVNNIFEFSLML